MNLVKSFFSGGREGAIIIFLGMGLIFMAMIGLIVLFSWIVWAVGVFGCLISSLIGYNELFKEYVNWLLLEQPGEQPTFDKTFIWVSMLLFEISFGGFCYSYNGGNEWAKKKAVQNSFGVGAGCTIWLLFFVQAMGTVLLSLEPLPLYQLCSVLLIPTAGVFVMCLVFETLISVGICVSKCFKTNKSCNVYLVNV